MLCPGHDGALVLLSGDMGGGGGHTRGPRPGGGGALGPSVLQASDGSQGEEGEGLDIGGQGRGLHVVPGPDLTGDRHRLLGADGGATEPGQVGHRALIGPQVSHAATQQEWGRGVSHYFFNPSRLGVVKRNRITNL